jgi:hypothetical protein
VVGCGIRWWWSVAHGARRSYSAAQYSECGRINRREAGAGCPWWFSGSGYGGGQSGTRAVK